jgi:dihydroneopterin aldolase
VTLGTIYLENLRFHAFHGVVEQERIVGNDYIINVSVQYPLEAACDSDDVNDTLNYASLADVIKEEMSIPSNLLEHVAQRIGKSIFIHFPLTECATIDIKKVAPPFSADCDGAGISITMQSQIQVSKVNDL